MAVTANQLAVALFDAAIGGYKATVDAFIYAQGENAAAEMMLRESGLNNVDNGVFAYLVVDKMVGATLTNAQKQAAADVLKAQLTAGQSRGQVVLYAINYLTSDAAKADATYKDAAARFANKIAAADVYAGNSTDLAALKGAIVNVTQDPATVPSTSVAKTFTMTVGADEFTGTAGSDVFNALSINGATGAAATTLNSFDTIDGGAGSDTLNVYVTAADNTAFPGNTVVKNIETVNLYNTAAPGATLTDASNYAGITTLKQVGTFVTNVTKLGADTTAAFKDTGVVAVTVTSADAAAKSSVALDNVGEGSTINTVATATGVLNSVTVSGTVKDTNADGTVANVNLNVTVGKDVESLAVNSAVATTLVVTDGAGTKKVGTVDAAASKGALTYVAAATVGAVTTGEGADTVTLATAYTATLKAATLTSGAGNDTLNVNVTNAGSDIADTTVVVNAGAGDDKVTLGVTNGATKAVGVTVDAGAGADTVTVGAYAVKTTDSIDGGEGTDTVSVVGKAARIDDDYIVLNKVLKNFETLQFSTVEGTGTALDAAKLAANYTTLNFFAGSSVDNVGAQALVANGNLNAEATGYKSTGENGGNGIVYAGSIAVTEKVSGVVQAHADSVNLTVSGGKGNAVAANASTLTGEVKSATVALSVGTDTKGTAATTDDTAVASTITVNTVNTLNGNVLKALASLTLTGNGSATVNNGVGTALVTVDASALASADLAGKAAAGLTYVTNNAAAETITLGAGLDSVNLNSGSVYGAIDTVTGINLVLDATGKFFDTTKGDTLMLGGANNTNAFKKFTTTQTDLDLALLDAAKSAVGNSLVFQMGGNTYIYVDAGNADLVDAADTVVKLTGTVSLDVLVEGL